MSKQLIPYAETGYFNKTVIDYLQGKEALHKFYEYELKAKLVERAIEKKSAHYRTRDLLYHVLKKQNQAYWQEKFFAGSRKNIESIQSKNTFTVATAHQPNLFLGPLYLVYKIISAINLAKKFRQQIPASDFVPVFWMGSEDHDTAELNHISFLNEKIEWETDQTGAFGRMKTHSLDTLIERMIESMGAASNAGLISNFLKVSYLNHQTIAEATRHALVHLFAEEGLIVVDGDDADLKKEFAFIAEKEFTGQFSYRVLSESNKQFRTNYETQVEPRDNNLFYLNENIRQRFVKHDNHWDVLNTDLHFSEEEIKQMLKDESQKFSPNVVLRPVYQELILPNVAFVGGGSEVAYWLQLKPLFDAYELPFPMVWLRNSVLWVDSAISKKMDKLGLNTAHFFSSSDQIIREYLQRSDGFSTEKMKDEITVQFDQLKNTAAEIDSTLQATVEAEKIKTLKSVFMLEEKMIRALKRKEETAVSAIRAIKEKLFPENNLQERHESFLTLYFKYGSLFVKMLLEQLDPMELQMTLISESKSANLNQ